MSNAEDVTGTQRGLDRQLAAVFGVLVVITVVFMLTTDADSLPSQIVRYVLFFGLGLTFPFLPLTWLTRRR